MSQINLGRLIKLLEQRPQDQRVCFDFCGFIPDRVRSYRGFYDQLALGYRGVDDNPPTVKVADLLGELRKAVGETYHGYKGGGYVMRESTEMWCANWGNCSDTAITGVDGNDFETIILTGWCAP